LAGGAPVSTARRLQRADDVRELGRRVWNAMSDDDVFDRAAALAYYFIFALFPTLLFLTSLLGLLPAAGLMDRLMAYAQRALPGDAASLVTRTLGEIEAGARGGLLSIGALAALWAASAGMASVMKALNVAYGLEDSRPWWKRRLLAVLLTVGFAGFILAALALIVFGPPLGLPLVIALVLVGIALVYHFAQATRQRWRWVTPGSVVALALWLAMSFGLRWYVARFTDYSATYGSIGGVILLMLWLYLMGLVLLVGAEINAEIEHAAAEQRAVPAQAAAAIAAPVDRVAGPSPPDDDVAVAGEAVSRWVGEARRRGWGSLALIGGGVVAGWLLRRRPMAQVASTGARLAGSALQVAAAIAALERFRHPRRGVAERRAA
jgi:membrane protein